MADKPTAPSRTTRDGVKQHSAAMTMPTMPVAMSLRSDISAVPSRGLSPGGEHRHEDSLSDLEGGLHRETEPDAVRVGSLAPGREMLLRAEVPLHCASGGRRAVVGVSDAGPYDRRGRGHGVEVVAGVARRNSNLGAAGGAGRPHRPVATEHR